MSKNSAYVDPDAGLPNTFNDEFQDSFLSNSKINMNMLKYFVRFLLGHVEATNESGELVNVTPDESRVHQTIGTAIDTLMTSELNEELSQIYSNDPVYGNLLIALIDVLGEAVRLRIPVPDLQKDLKKLSIPHKYVDIIASIFSEQQIELEQASRTHRQILPSLTNFEWRVDVTITTTQLNKVLKPNILMQMTTSEGEINTFECSVEKFHQLRYSVTKMLASMQNIERHPTLMRLVD